MITLDEYVILIDRKITIRLSLAIALIDEYTGKQPIGYIRVFIKGKNLEAAKNRSGYYLFDHLPDAKFIRVESEFYFEREIAVKSSDLNPQNPVMSITIKPKPCYPFPAGATLIRGMVQDSKGNSVSGAKVEVKGKKVSNRTTVKGEFVLYFKALTEEEIIVKNSKRFVKGNADGTIHLKTTHDSKTGKADLVEIEECKAALLGPPIIID